MLKQIIDQMNHHDPTSDHRVRYEGEIQNDVPKDVFIYSEMDAHEIKRSIISLLIDNQISFCDSSCFLPEETGLNSFANCLQSSRQVALIISPQFLDCKLSLFYSEMAAQYTGDIIVVAFNVLISQIPQNLKSFNIISVNEDKEWFVKIQQYLQSQHHVVYPQAELSDEPDPGILQFTDAPLLANVHSHVDRLQYTDEEKQALFLPNICEKSRFGTHPFQPSYFALQMGYFYQLQHTDKIAYQALDDYQCEDIVIKNGDILQIIEDSPRLRRKVVVENALGQRGSIPLAILSQIESQLPVLLLKTLRSTISDTDTTIFRQTLETIGLPFYVARGTEISSNPLFSIRKGDVLQVLAYDKTKLLIRNCRGVCGFLSRNDSMTYI
ncbi:uncharacterized protein LOC126819373 [Patella vulgata]|uniref:uncharacterized protein LOC126819373 n=1 Tax=Patella vulgata TaxID=6465 RepID=UPI002180093C|nr:uncharacterized protein LOC126819373 [Patella vulgata]